MPVYLNTASDIASLAKRIRRKRGLTQRAVSDLMGTHASYMCMVETGRYKPSMDSLIAMLDVLGYRLAITPKDSPTPP
jgi:transcriptional regulator with XRE-family HTH domain